MHSPQTTNTDTAVRVYKRNDNNDRSIDRLVLVPLLPFRCRCAADDPSICFLYCLWDQLIVCLTCLMEDRSIDRLPLPLLPFRCRAVAVAVLLPMNYDKLIARLISSPLSVGPRRSVSSLMLVPAAADWMVGFAADAISVLSLPLFRCCCCRFVLQESIIIVIDHRFRCCCFVAAISVCNRCCC